MRFLKSTMLALLFISANVDTSAAAGPNRRDLWDRVGPSLIEEPAPPLDTDSDECKKIREQLSFLKGELDVLRFRVDSLQHQNSSNHELIGFWLDLLPPADYTPEQLPAWFEWREQRIQELREEYDVIEARLGDILGVQIPGMESDIDGLSARYAMLCGGS